MREIIQINVGQCGSGVGSAFWRLIGQEHSIGLDGAYSGSDDDELANANVFYCETAAGRFVPRSVFVDLDPRSNDAVLGGDMGRLFGMDSFVSGLAGTGNNWAKGYF
mmetsp:Transcript_34676/g.40131  ORF Transcript_34676/g.40131 Transcript_34676/m.40131 type:complete len:107 (+) Transcript_34676:12-332(+)